MQSFKTALALAALALSLSACDNAIYDHDAACREGLQLRFVYDYNMEWADAFPSKVHCLTVLVYDKEGQLVERRSESSDLLRNPDYRMTFDLPAGSYHVAAYGGMECNDASFAFDADPANLTRDQRTVSLTSARNQSDTTVSDHLLHDHFHGTIDVEVAEADFDYTFATVEMMKNTNNFRIMLQQVDGTPLYADDFNISFSDDNIHFAADNSLLPTEGGITYLPWSKGQSGVGTNDNGEDWLVAHYDLSTSRIIKRTSSRAGAPGGTSSVDSPRMVVNRADNGATIADLPLVNYLLLMKGDHYSSLGDQEFLDRQSEWNIMLFLDQNQQWINTHIVVNDWVVRINDITE